MYLKGREAVRYRIRHIVTAMKHEAIFGARTPLTCACQCCKSRGGGTSRLISDRSDEDRRSKTTRHKEAMSVKSNPDLNDELVIN